LFYMFMFLNILWKIDCERVFDVLRSRLLRA
jgi:hypothetical protein